MAERSKRHHYVPQLHLRAFACEQARVATFDRRDGGCFVQSVENAAAENHYNTTRMADGSSSDAAESLISEFEGMWAPALQLVRDGDWLADPSTKVHLAHFLAFQYLRVPRQRSAADRRATFLTRLELAAAGPRQISNDMGDLGAAPEEASVLADSTRNQSLDQLEIQLPTNQHLRSQFGLMQRLALMMEVGYRWSAIRWKRCSLLTSDDPVVLMPAPDHPRWSSIGFATAGWIQLAIDRHTALLLTNLSDLEASGRHDAPDRNSRPGTFSLARQLNERTADQASRFVFHHPDDELTALVGEDHLLPRTRDRMLETEAMVAMRRKLVAANEWASSNSDQEHPLSRLPRPPARPPGARPLAIDGRSRRARDMHDRLERAEPLEVPSD